MDRHGTTTPLGHPDNSGRHGTTIALDIQRAASTKEACADQLDMSLGQPHLHGSRAGNSSHTKTKRYLTLGHPDYGTSRAGAWFSQLDMRLGRSDLPTTDIDDFNAKL